VAKKASFALAVLILLAAGYAVFTAHGWPRKAALFPLAIGAPLLVLALIEAIWAFKSNEAEGDPMPRGIALPWAWIVGFLALIALLGFPIAVAAFMLAYLKFAAKEDWIFSVVVTALVWGAFYGLFDAMLHLPFPAGWLLEWLGFAA